MNHDEQHLELLAIFHYIVAGLAGLFSLIPVIHLVLGIGLIRHAQFSTPEAIMGWFFVAIAALIIAAGLAFAIFLAIAGRALQRQRRYTLCQVMAAISCVFVPFGTVLGVFTLLVLARPTVRERFGVVLEPPPVQGADG